MYTIPLYSTWPCSKAHWSDLIVLVPDHFSSFTAFTTASSWYLDDLILLSNFSSCSSISKWPWCKARTQKNSGLRRVMSSLSDSIPFLRSACLDKASVLAMSEPALCSRWKSKCNKYIAQHACHLFSFLAIIKYSRFWWSVQITHCCLWGHNTNFCNSTRIFSPICMGPHHKENHCSLSVCCKGCSHLNPPIPPTADGTPCPHLALCWNCGKTHAANSPCCQFWQHRFDRSWMPPGRGGWFLWFWRDACWWCWNGGLGEGLRGGWNWDGRVISSYVCALTTFIMSYLPISMLKNIYETSNRSWPVVNWSWSELVRLVGRHTHFFWNGKLSEPFPCDIGVGQGSALSPI